MCIFSKIDDLQWSQNEAPERHAFLKSSNSAVIGRYPNIDQNPLEKTQST